MECAATDLLCGWQGQLVLLGAKAVTPAAVFPGSKSVLSSQGGTPPFNYRVLAGPGFVTRSGILSARPLLGDIVVEVTDRFGFTSLHTIVVTGGAGNGTFSSPRFTGVCATPNIVRGADLNLDGNQDLVVACSSSNEFQVLLGSGDGSFASPVSYAAPAPTYHIALGDPTGDGILDVAVDFHNSTNPGLAIYPGNGDGTFGARIDRPTIANSKASGAILLGDFNGDGLDDLIAAHTTTIEVFLGTGDAGAVSSTSSSFNSPGSTQNAAVEDYNSDGRLDLLLGKAGNPAAFHLHLNDSLGGFESNQQFPVVVGGGMGLLSSVVPGDWNGDSNMDVAALSKLTRDVHVGYGNGQADFSGYLVLTLAGENPIDAVTGDYNGDSLLDLAVVAEDNHQVEVFLGESGGTFASGVVYVSAALSSPSVIIAIDLNNDGRPDLVTNSGGSSQLAVLIGQ